MNGAESLVRTLAACGVEVCFANPGTSEMHLVAALDSIEGIHPVLTLFEGVATGAADGYGRIAEKPAATLLHLGPGLANGLANLHNARRAASPIVNIVGDHATYHARYDAPLTSDIAGFARPVSAWIRSSTDARSVAADAALAVQAARRAPGQIATLILPADAAWNESDGPAGLLEPMRAATVANLAVETAARALKAGPRAALLLRGTPLRAEGLRAAGRIAAGTGCRILCDTLAPRVDRGAGLFAAERVPYFAEDMVAFFKDFDQLILVNAKPPIAFFAYPDKPSWCLPEACNVHYLSHEHEDGIGALEILADLLAAPADPAGCAPLKLPDVPTGKFNALTIGQAIARLLPEGAIISDDSATSGWGTLVSTTSARPHSYLSLTGGSLGQGAPLAIGAALARPGRKVVCLLGDGSGMYTPQALWTQARENLDVITVVFANRSYRILKVELKRVGVPEVGKRGSSLLELQRPDLDWAGLARSMGVEATRAESIEAFCDQLLSAMQARGPRLIEAVI